jgi:hypothetical protein
MTQRDHLKDYLYLLALVGYFNQTFMQYLLFNWFFIASW